MFRRIFWSYIGLVLMILSATANADALLRRPLHQETEITKAEKPAVVILVPDSQDYRQLGKQLSKTIQQRSGIRLEVKDASDYVAHRPRLVKPELLNKHFILLGQFWNNAVLERLYAGFYDPTDALFPGPGGYELRTVCSPFKNGQNCVVATGSDLEGCRKAVAALPEEIVDGRIPFLHQVHLTGDAASSEENYRKRADVYLADLNDYAIFGRSGAKTFSGENAENFLVWNYRNLAVAACFGLRFWTAGNPRDADAFKRIVLGCRDQVDKLVKAYEEGKSDLMDYSGGELSIAWEIIEASPVFTDTERQQINDYIFQLACLNKNAYYLYKCKDMPFAEMDFYGRHSIAGTFWFGIESDYLVRNFDLTIQQRQLADEWHADAYHYLQRLSQSYFYSDGTSLVDNEGELVTRYALMTGVYDCIDNGSLHQLADYWVDNHAPSASVAYSGHNGTGAPASGCVLNAGAWQYPGEGYSWFRQSLGRQSYHSFLFYMAEWTGMNIPYFNWEMPPVDDGSSKLKSRITGIDVLPLAKAFHEYIELHPDHWNGGYERTPGRYYYDPVPYNQAYKRIALRGGFGKNDQYLVLDGMQGVEWSYDDINNIACYEDLGRALLKPQWGARSVESRLEMNTLFISSGVPENKQSIAAKLLAAADFKSCGFVSSLAQHHDGAAWTRNIFWQKGEKMIIADQVVPYASGDMFLVNTWLSYAQFVLKDNIEGIADLNGVTLHVISTPDRTLELAMNEHGPEGMRQKVSAKLQQGKPFTLWTLLYASDTNRPAAFKMRRIAPNAVLTYNPTSNRNASLVFTGDIDLSGISIKADMGIISLESIDLVGCRSMSIAGSTVVTSPKGCTFSWNLTANSFDKGKAGFGLTQGIQPAGLRTAKAAMIAGLAKSLADAAEKPEYTPIEVASVKVDSAPALKITQRMKLAPVCLAISPGKDCDSLLLYDEQGNLKLPAIKDFNCPPVAVDFEGTGKSDIGVAIGNTIFVYHSDGTLRWQRELPINAERLIAGDLNGDGHEELGVLVNSAAVVFDAAGNRVINEDTYVYSGIGGAFGDVDGDGRREFVAVTISGVNVMRPDAPRKWIGFGSYLGTMPCRVWLKDLNRDGIPKCYIGGGGSDLACYDLKEMKTVWTFKGAAIHPADAALFDVDGDGKMEMVGGGADGFLYVVNIDGKYLFSRMVGSGVTVLAVASKGAEASDVLIAGTQTGDVIALGKNLQIIGRASIGKEPVSDLASLNQAVGKPIIIASDKTGNAVSIRL